jgi:hypothetical protein
MVIGLSIPISLFFAVITLQLLGRTLNVRIARGSRVLDRHRDRRRADRSGQHPALHPGRQGPWQATVAGTREVIPHCSRPC